MNSKCEQLFELNNASFCVTSSKKNKLYLSEYTVM